MFEFGGGRLLLRGPNGSGKSKAMELLFPFLFDGDMAATEARPVRQARAEDEVEPADGRQARAPHRLLPGSSSATTTREQTPQYATFGVCLDAHREWDDVKPRFFHVAGKRVGHDFELVDERPAAARPPRNSTSS